MVTARRHQGFTLLEMIVAIGIFALISIASYTTLIRFIKDRDVMEKHNLRVSRLQSTFAVLERDVRFSVHRPIRSNYNESHPDKVAMCFADDDDCSEGDRLRLTTHQMEPFSYNIAGGRLTRVAWRLEGDRLYRITWPVLDRVQDSAERRRLMLDNVGDIVVGAYVAPQTSGQGAPVNSNTASPGVGPSALDNQYPASVLEVLVTVDGRRYRRLLEVSNGS